jgi:hypothetical protein
VTASEYYRYGSAERRAAIEAFVETLPAAFSQLLTDAFELIGERSAPRLSQLLTVEETEQITAFFRSPAARPAWEHHFRESVLGNSNAVFPLLERMDREAVEDFSRTPGGRAFLRREDAIADILDAEFDGALAQAFGATQISLARGLCEALAEDCPAGLRAQSQAT